MLSRYRIRLDADAGIGDNICVRTWPSVHKGLSACREFEIFCNGILIGSASTAWMLIDLESRRPVRPSDRIGEAALIDRQVFSDPLKALKISTEFESTLSFRVRRADLDLNRHVNNRVFFDWASEALEVNLIKDLRLQQVEINYLAEALTGEEVLSCCSSQTRADGLLCSHLISRPADHKDLAKLQTLWVLRG